MSAVNSRSAPSCKFNSTQTLIPTRWIGPVHFNFQGVSDQTNVPLATYETTLWPSTNRGAKVTRLAGGITTTLIQDTMSRSFILRAPSGQEAVTLSRLIRADLSTLGTLVSQSSHHAVLQDIHIEICGKNIYLRLAISSGEASGHNMVTKAADYLIQHLLQKFPQLEYGSISGNICVDKKVSAINGILGRGKHLLAEVIIPADLCTTLLKTTPDKIHRLNMEKNYVGSILAGSLRSANAHFANLLLALYLATGQDAANIVEGSQGIVSTDVTAEGLYFAVNLPNLIIGTVGNGKHHDFVQENLKLLKCLPHADISSIKSKENAYRTKSGILANSCSQRLSAIMAATILCGELSLLAAQTNKGELMRAHENFERR